MLSPSAPGKSSPTRYVTFTLMVTGSLQGAGCIRLAGDTSQGSDATTVTTSPPAKQYRRTMQDRNITAQARWANSGPVLATGNWSATGQLTGTGDIMSQGDITLKAATTDNRGSPLRPPPLTEIHR